MVKQDFGLTKVPTDALKKMLSFLYREELTTPITPVKLTCVGLQVHVNSIMDSVRGLDEKGVRSVLVAVLAERDAAES